jgi:signal transduction histidine kinase
MGKEQESQVLRFEPSAYLQRLIGRELISNEYIAVAELVKNAYDAGATEVIVELKRDVPQSLVVLDNGLGMSLEEFERLWMVPGYSEKVEAGEAAKRPLLGEKGIGRFAADRLAEKLTVVTKTVGEDDALWVVFDWKEFEDRKKKMRDIPIPYSRKPDPDLGKWSSGTKLDLEELRKEWTRTDWRKLRRELQSLVTPFRTVRGFKITANAERWESGEVESPFEAQEGYKYSFSLSKGGRITRKTSRPKRVAKELGKQIEETKRKMYGTTSFGPIKGAFYYMDHPRSLKRRGFESGVGIYRDRFRVEPYGRPDDDWLEVKSWKASRSGHAPITPSRLFGFVEITRDENPRLKDVTNREGLLDTPEFAEFRSFVIREFRYFAEEIVGREKDELEPSESIKAQRAQVTRRTRARAFAEMASQLAHQLRQPLSHIRVSATNLRDWLERAEALDENAQQFTDRIERNVLRMDENITNLSKVAQGLRDEVVEFDLGAFAREVTSRHEADFVQAGAALELVNCDDGHKVKFSRVALGFILDNFLTNALRATSDADDLPGKVVVEVQRLAQGKYRLTVTDNGKGIPSDYRDKLFEKFIPSEHGHGMGLFWSKIWAKEYGGDIDYEDVEPSGATFFVIFEQEG